MAGYAELVPIRIAEIRAIVLFVVLGPEPRRSFRSAAVGERHGVGSVHEAATLREEGDHLAIARLVRQFVVGSADEKQGSRSRSGLPTSPWALPFAETRRHSEQRHQRVVKRERAVEIVDTDKDVRKHVAVLAMNSPDA
jgi:hypothetical protein